MITEPRVFDDEYLPEIKHRGAEMDVLTDALAPVLRDERGHDVLLAGPQGVGKTVLARAALDRLSYQRATPTAHVQCLGESTAGILRSVLAALPGPTPARTTARETLEEQLASRVQAPTVVILDEASQVHETDVLAVFRRIPRLSWIAICHDATDWLSVATDETRHAVTNWTLGLDKYSTAELADILADRRRMGMEAGVIDDYQLHQIADEAAGVARRGIYSLRAAGELAAARSHRAVQDVDVADAFDRADRQMREAALASLPFHHHVLYEIVRRRGELSSRALHERYEAIERAVYDGRDRRPVSKRDRRNNSRSSWRTIWSSGQGKDQSGPTDPVMLPSRRRWIWRFPCRSRVLA